MAEFINDAAANQLGRVLSPAQYMEALTSGEQFELEPESTLRGRILRGRSEEEFELLGSAERDIVFIMGPDGLSLLPGLETSEALDRIGLTPRYVQGRRDQGYRFRLLVFEGGDAAPLATWDNALDMVAGFQPELAADIERHRDALKTKSLTDFEAGLSEPMEVIDLAGSTHPEYMSLERYLALSPEERENPANLRRVLFHSQHLGTLFYGDGYTRTPDGQIGLAEYLVPNGRIADLPEAVTLDLL